MPESPEQFRASVQAIVTSIVTPTLEAGGDGPDILAKTQFVLTGVLMFLDADPAEAMDALSKAVVVHHAQVKAEMKERAN